MARRKRDIAERICPICREPIGTQSWVTAHSGRVCHRACFAKTSPAKLKPPVPLSHCSFCREPLAGRPTAKTRADREVHRLCLNLARKTTTAASRKRRQPPKSDAAAIAAGWGIHEAAREFERNRGAVMSGEAYRSRKPSDWKLSRS
ncbi:hypothetical protein [Streptomyces sp. NPDC051219]|uniref:hypothetical protein n=1 Tax=Streptomyces sp. NPDC051219 TaxID=3155283 RepID=UPI00343CE445